jgi:hypothetical protein
MARAPLQMSPLRGPASLRWTVMTILPSGRRSLGDDAVWLEGLQVLARNPLARGIARLFRLDLDAIDEVFRDSDQLIETFAMSVALFTKRGWAPSGSMPTSIYEAAVKVLADGGTVEAAEEALVHGWNDRTTLSSLHHRVLGLGLGKDEELESWYRDRGRLVRRAWEHHVAGAYEAAVPLVFAQIDGITADATATPEKPVGRMFFSTHPARQAEVVDDTTLAGMNEALPVVRDYFSAGRGFTGALGSDSRHGVMHGRELRYDTKANSTKAFVLLAAVVEWAQPRIRAEIDRRVAERDQRYANSDEIDAEGRRLDRRGFVPTRTVLRSLGLAQAGYRRVHDRFGSMEALLVDARARYLVEEPETMTVARVTANDWWAWRRSESGWVFAIGCAGDDPLDLRYFDGRQVPEHGPLEGGWTNSDTGNWSGDWC